MVERRRDYEIRYGMKLPVGKISPEEELAKEAVAIIKKAPTFKSAKKALEIMGEMLEEYPIG
jgi:hypothetical protein